MGVGSFFERKMEQINEFDITEQSVRVSASAA